jgi:hypothetical protein
MKWWTPLTKEFRQDKAKRWQELGREFALHGRHEESRLCHEMADYYRLPFVLHFFSGWDGVVKHKQLEKLVKENNEKIHQNSTRSV